jgi:hypothetical protein
MWRANNMDDNIKRGMELLDSTRPGWRNKIDLTLLDMNDSDFCIIGQLTGNYYDHYQDILGPVLHEYESVDQAAAAYGFQLDWIGRNYIELTEDWREALGT